MKTKNNLAGYRNRYGDLITFEHIDNQVFMRGGKWFRYGYDDDNKTINMVDPSGGPYIDIKDNLNEFWPKNQYQDLFIESITFGENVEDCDDCESLVIFNIKQ